MKLTPQFRLPALLTLCVAIVLSIGMAPSAGKAAEPSITIKPGKYLLKVGERAEEDANCFKDDKLTASVFKSMMEQDTDMSCEILDSSASGNTLKYRMKCLDTKAKQNFEFDTAVTVKGDQILIPMTVKIDVDAKPMEMKSEGVARRTGDC